MAIDKCSNEAAIRTGFTRNEDSQADRGHLEALYCRPMTIDGLNRQRKNLTNVKIPPRECKTEYMLLGDRCPRLTIGVEDIGTTTMNERNVPTSSPATAWEY